MIREKHHTSSIKFFKGLNFFSNSKGSHRKQEEQPSDRRDDSIALTLTTDIEPNSISYRDNKSIITLLDSETIDFIPYSYRPSFLFHQEKAYVHYDPKRARVTLGASSDSRHTKKTILHLTVEQYAWLIQQLQEELGILQTTNNTFYYSPMLGIMSNQLPATMSIRKRLIRFVTKKKRYLSVVTTLTNRQCILFMLPKTLLLQAAIHIPNTKPLPPSPLSPNYNFLLSQKPYKVIQDAFYLRLKRYCQHVSLCSHELLAGTSKQDEPSPPSSLSHSYRQNEFISIRCADCSVVTKLETIKPNAHQQQTLVPSSMITTNSVMFPVSYMQYTISSIATVIGANRHQLFFRSQKSLQYEPSRSKQHISFMSSSAIIQSFGKEDKRTLFDSEQQKSPTYHQSAFQYIPPDRTMTSSGISSISQCLNTEEEHETIDDGLYPEQKYGYVAVDNKHEEILAVFPGMSNLLEHTSFAAVPWLDLGSASSLLAATQDEEPPWVLECALKAWNQCEMKVVTLLMRLCNTTPSHYKIVVIGHSLGGAIAALCASSLRSTRLFVDRSITDVWLTSFRRINSYLAL
ncbi:MAG: hypothetical protein EXX96DRAFT_332997 [Benjaminiella poitrasii]|nr:MAG: hypothetical protein EXX96DRAFT_332997 [Benjaminiella poitrasii]